MLNIFASRIFALNSAVVKTQMSRDMIFQQCGMCDQQSLRSACAYAQSNQSLCKSLEFSMTVKLLTEHHLEFLSLKGEQSNKNCVCDGTKKWLLHVVHR